MQIIYNLLFGLIIYLPAFVANGTAPFIREGTPIDRRKNFNDGRRILGDGKTFEGLLVGVTFGTTLGGIISRFLGIDWIFYSAIISASALFGDMLGAFIKRRLNIPRGGRALGLDQLDFILGASLAIFGLRISVTIYQFLFVAFVAFILHILTNYIAYRLKIKSVPW
ncbi:CDP-2,3-bis-(O-geranylgeranyl)-sn-glycerol synthase [Candidatus Acidianus copahuensis]|uniref:CDP-archaeol synthase n=1 Tax=Candidatus Acidianus copahuensis TaxID=1160895 RepID=A0A031LL72_9CREN|nr:CDP-2,3-bis-(O-geranylgeranyl)-sn-glycerol synthase [Candidatus Acidianus copahuensis]EZQ02404.1 hypothetical protein CM19_10460 [Candidatus Acidianus copahuensis]NON63387.1 CDP-2,3-bis-(O-geranylgeranyl)-sn-glycerol synthase [Acidianus sp. RZ1]